MGHYRYLDSNYTTVNEIHYNVDARAQIPKELDKYGKIYLNISHNPHGFVENLDEERKIYTIKNFKCYTNPNESENVDLYGFDYDWNEA